MERQTDEGIWVPGEYGGDAQVAVPPATELTGSGQRPSRLPSGDGMVVNETGLPDAMVLSGVRDYFVEHASMAWGHGTNFQTYANQQGSLLARRDYQTPTNVIEEIKLARDLAERDDDIRAVMGSMVAIAFGEGMEHAHEDERTLALFNSIARNANLDGAMKEMYREYLIASSVTTAALFTRESLDFTPAGGNVLSETVSAPLIGVLPAENIRIIGNDMFGTAILAYDPPEDRLRRWLDEYFDPNTTPGRKAELGRQDRVSANMFVGVVEVDPMAPPEDRPGNWGYDRLYLLNPRMCHRTTMPKGAWKYPRPLLTADFALLEAKRLLNIMDYALLQGGSNFIVVAKKGSDERPGQPEEIENLKQVVRHASRSGVIVGDHRLSFEIITPKLEELLNAEKRKLLGRKLAMTMLRVPERDDNTAEGEKSEVEITARVITSDRQDLRRHVENRIYPEVVKRNRRLFTKGSAAIWFPKIILQGLNFFTDLVLKLRDRGDISRGTAVAAAGFQWDAEVGKRKRELARGDDDVMQPGTVPHSSPESGPQDNNTGRPPGAQDGRPSQDGFSPRRVINRNPGETIRAWYDEDEEAIVRMGEITYAILDEYAETKSMGRVTRPEREIAMQEEATPRQVGPIAIVPVNVGVPVEEELRAVRLGEGLSMIVGYRLSDGAIIAKAISFREQEFDAREAENRVVRWGFPMALLESGEPQPEPEPETPPSE